MMTCPSSDSRCAAARAGTGSAQNNNNFPMVRIDVDGDPTTSTSSSSTLTLPDGAQVLFAGLYYGARSTAGSGGAPPPDPSAPGLSTVKLRPPGASGYLTLGPAGTVLDTSTAAEWAGFIDVTSEVATAGAGEYFVADIQSATGTDRFAAWALVVAYRDTSQPARNLSVFDGLQPVRANQSVSIPLTGFRTPPAGPVRTTVGFVVYEGDRGSTGPFASLNNVVLQDALNPANNFFNSEMSHLGTRFTAKDPNYRNQMGFDLMLVNANGILDNNATSAVIRTGTTQEIFLPHAITFATELFAPSVDASKTVANVTHPGEEPGPGDVLRYTVTFTNTGQDAAIDFVASDAIPSGTTYVPGSLQVVAGDDPGAKTDAAGDDEAELDTANNRVVFRLGTGADAQDGGRLAASGGTASFRFDVTLDGGVPDGTEIVNRASAEFFADTLGVPLTADAEVTTTAIAPDLTIDKTHTGPFTAGLPTPFTIHVENVGSHETDGSTVTVSDTFPAAAFTSISVTSAPGWSCNVAGTTLSCTRSDVLAEGNAYPSILVDAVVAAPAPAAIQNTATVTGGADANDTNNASTDVGPGVTEADLQLTKQAEPDTVFTGDRVTFTLRVRNGGPSPATGVVLDDPLAPNFDALNVETTQGTCDPTVQCAIGTLADGEEATVTVTATVVGTGPAHDNTASVSSGVDDPTPGNDTATATVNVPNTADLALTKSASPENPVAGAPDGLTYTITVENNGPVTATNVTVTDQLPGTFTPSSAGGGGFTCDLPGAGGTVTCTRASLAVADGQVAITIVGTLSAASAGTVVLNSARVDADQGDPGVLNNDGDTVASLVTPTADLDVLKFADRTSVRAGRLVRYTLRVTNNGPADAPNVRLTDSLTGSLRVVSVSESQGSCTPGRPVRCTLGTIPVGGAATVTVTVRPLRPGTISDSALATSDLSDPVPPNSVGHLSATRVTSGSGKVSITKDANRRRIGAFERVRFTIVVRALGPASARKLKICDPLPDLLGLRRAKGARIRNGAPCWRIGILAPGERRTFRLTAFGANSGFTQRVVNRATVKGANVAGRAAAAAVVVRGARVGGDCLAAASTACSGLAP